LTPNNIKSIHGIAALFSDNLICTLNNLILHVYLIYLFGCVDDVRFEFVGIP
jgi:hypothetical protein